jgi:alpha-1,2-mannosyltransferase
MQGTATTRQTPDGWIHRHLAAIKILIGVLAATMWGLFFDQLVRVGQWIFDTSPPVRLEPLSDLHYRFNDAHIAWVHGNLYAARVGSFSYPPFTAYIFLPFHLIGLQATDILWTVGSVFALAAVLSVALARWFPISGTDAWLASSAGLAPAAVFALYPFRSDLYWGQFGVFLLALVFIDLFCVPKRFRGVLIGLATAIKLLPGIFVFWLLFKRDLPSVARAVGTFLALTLLAAIFWPHASIEFWFHILPSGHQIQMAADGPGKVINRATWYLGVGRVANQSIRGLLAKPPFIWLGMWPWLPIAAIVLCGGIWIAWRLSEQQRDLAGFIVLALTGVLVSPVSWLHYWVFVGLAPFLAIIEWRRARPIAIASIVLALSTCANLESGSVPHFSPIGSPALFVVRNLYVLGGLGFLVVAGFLAANGGSVEPVGDYKRVRT